MRQAATPSTASTRRQATSTSIAFGLAGIAGVGLTAALAALTTSRRVGYPDGLLLTTTNKWRKPPLDNQVADLFERFAEPVDVPRGSRIIAYAWGQTDIDPPPGGCPPLRAPE